MRADRPLLVSAVFLGAGLWMIFRYGASGAGITRALRWSNIGFHFNLAASGPAALGGAAPIAIGILFLLWALLAALAWHATLLFDRYDDDRDFLRIMPGASEDLDDRPSESIPGRGSFL
jgi:hypothetical protein